MVNILKGVIERGTGKKLKKLKLEIAGKTGTTNENLDAWFIGFTPELLVGVYIGFDEPSTLGKKDWNKTGSPPPAALKNDVPKWMSISIMVTTPANTGITAISKNAVINHVQANSGIFINVIPGARIFNIVAMMLIAPMIDDAPIIWTPKIKNVTDSGA